VLDAAERQLGEYFAGARDAFTLALRPLGTPFQQRVWACLTRIGYGAVCSYAELAREVGSPRAMRAVGSANAHNPLSLFVPCHRVVGADGSLRGYAGGHERKAWLLAHERSC
jgi:methylated-DNA-[protein]-cysteine S-methyltransferase